MANSDELFTKLQRKLFDDWRDTHLQPDGSYKSKLYKITDEDFIKRLENEKLCEYQIQEDGTVKADIVKLQYEDQPKDISEKNKDVDKLLLELCLKR
ncbi:MAG: hypothetical protein FWF46_06950 [Oscillospiraceae bacterium]|nr:hypothetical protein [Oscillospiraceae bacterium]